MHPRVTEVLTYVDEERAALRRAAEAVPAALRERPPAPDRWSAAQVLEHCALIEGWVAALVGAQVAAGRARGVGPETESTPVRGTVDAATLRDRSIRAAAPEIVHPSRDVDMPAACRALDASGSALAAAFASGDGLALGALAAPHPILGSMNLYQWGLAVGGHHARHAAQIAEIAADLAGRGAGAASGG